MTLELVQMFDEQSLEERRQHVEGLRARRMVAAIEYFESLKQKYDRRTDVLARRLMQQYDMLGKEIERADKALAKIDARMVTIDGLKAEMGLARDIALVLTPEDDPE